MAANFGTAYLDASTFTITFDGPTATPTYANGAVSAPILGNTGNRAGIKAEAKTVYSIVGAPVPVGIALPRPVSNGVCLCTVWFQDLTSGQKLWCDAKLDLNGAVTAHFYSTFSSGNDVQATTNINSSSSITALRVSADRTARTITYDVQVDGTTWTSFYALPLTGSVAPGNAGSVFDLDNLTLRIEVNNSGYATATATTNTYGIGAINGNTAPSNTPTVSSVAVAPGTATVTGSATQQFAATVTGTNSPAQTVNWTVPVGVGTVNSAGLYTAPAGTSSAQSATVRATSTVDATKYGEAAVTIPAVTASSITLGCGPTATLIDGQTLALMPVVGPSGASQAVDYTISPNVGSISGSNIYTPPAQQASAQTVTITAKPAGMSSPSYVVTVTIPSNTPSIRVLDGVTPVANGGTVAVMRQAGAGVTTRYVYVDNGSGAVSGGDNALTGLSVSVSPTVSWLTVALNQTTAGAVLSLAVTSPASVPGTADPDVTVTVASTVANVASRTFVVPGVVAAAAAAGSLTLAQLGQFNRIEQMLLPVSSALGNLSALGGTTQDKFNEVLALQRDDAGLSAVLDARIVAGLAPGVALTPAQVTAIRNGLSTLGSADLTPIATRVAALPDATGVGGAVNALLDAPNGVEVGVSLRHALQVIAAVLAGKIDTSTPGVLKVTGVGTDTIRLQATGTDTAPRQSVALSLATPTQA